MQHIHSLTGLRGLAALLVFISHSANRGFLPEYLGQGFGQTGVMLFFVLSGFLMCHLYASRDFTFQNVRAYILARIGRVFPLYIVLLLVSYIISSYFYQEFYFDYSNPKSLAKALLFQNARLHILDNPCRGAILCNFYRILDHVSARDYELGRSSWVLYFAPQRINLLHGSR